MVRTVNLNTDIPANRELGITLPANVPIGPAEIVLVVSSLDHAGGRTVGDFGRSEFFGMWRDRSEMTLRVDGETVPLVTRLHSRRSVDSTLPRVPSSDKNYVRGAMFISRIGLRVV